MSSIKSIRGFLIFLALMILTFASTSNLFLKNKFRHDAFQNAPRPWLFEHEFFENYHAKKDLYIDFKVIIKQIFLTWLSIVKGDFDEKLKNNIDY